ncbi:MAG: flagellar biosynthetic protein FliO [bacterium]|nr:flagellar biosynthetic protein FliO [bacterium]
MNKRRNRIVFVIFLLASIFILPVLLHPQKNITTNTQAKDDLFRYRTPEETVRGPSYFGLVFKTIFILGFFGFGVYFLFKYLAQKQGLAAPNLNIIRMITSVPVGTNRFIQLIQIGNNYFLIGVSENNISLLKEITDKETVNMIQIEKNKKVDITQKVVFTDFLRSILSGLAKKTGWTDHSRFLKKQKERLQNLKIKM